MGGGWVYWKEAELWMGHGRELLFLKVALLTPRFKRLPAVNYEEEHKFIKSSSLPRQPCLEHDLQK